MDRSSGPLGYLFTDIDGSTERWERSPSEMERAVALHNGIIDRLLTRHGGALKDRAGDGVFALFDGGDPLACALAIQLALQREDWTAIGGLGVRIGVHAGANQVAINRAARVTKSGWGGQIVVSSDAADAYALPEGAQLVDLGLSRLKGVDEPLRLFSLVHPEMERTEFPPLRLDAIAGSSATAFPTPFFGRKRECEGVARLLEDTETRVVSLVGPGGNGKTRFAAYVGAAALDRCAVWFVTLDAAASGADLTAAVAGALRVPLHGAVPATEQVLAHLRSKHGLLVLDNADGLVREAAAFVSELRVRCEGVAVLITSRSPLSISGETVYLVTGFPPPGRREADVRASAAFQLFTYEARLGRPDFELEAGEYDAFRELCELLGGSPLALRLAAQWRRVLPLRQILERVRGNLDFLRSTETDVPDRQRSLRGVFEGSWELLAASERRSLARLSIFCGGFDAIAAEQAGGVELAALKALAERGLIERRDHGRFVMHAMVRDYARERLVEAGDESDARARHAEYYLDCLRTEFAQAASVGQRIVLDRLERETANILAAWRHAVDRRAWKEVETAAEPLFYSLVLRARYRDAVGFFRSEASTPRIQAYFASLQANCLVQLGQLDEAAALADTVLETKPCALLANAHARQALGLIAHARGNWTTALSHYVEALAIRRRRDDHLGCYYSAASLAILHLLLGDTQAARERIKESFQCCERTGNQSGLMIVHVLAGDLALREGRLEDARRSYEEALEIEEEIQHPQHRARVLNKLGGLFALSGEHGAALRRHHEALASAIQIDDQRHKIEALLGIGGALRQQGRAEKAKIRYIQAMRAAMDLGARPLLVRCLLDLARLEADTGNIERAQRLASVLADADLGPAQADYDALLAGLPGTPTAGPKLSPEAAVQAVIEETDLASLRL